MSRRMQLELVKIASLAMERAKDVNAFTFHESLNSIERNIRKVRRVFTKY